MYLVSEVEEIQDADEVVDLARANLARADLERADQARADQARAGHQRNEELLVRLVAMVTAEIEFCPKPSGMTTEMHLFDVLDIA